MLTGDVSEAARGESSLEYFARFIVESNLGLSVARFEDGRVPSQVDAVIDRGGNMVPLEVVSDTDSEFLRQWDALEKRGRLIHVPGMVPGWYVTAKRSANVGQLRAELPPLFRTHGEQIAEDRFHAIPAPLARLGVTYAMPMWKSEWHERIHISGEGWASWDDPIDLNAWVERVLHREADVPAKLRAFGSDEAHAFIWAALGSSWSITSLLEDPDEMDVPTLGPTLPAGITDIWVAATRTATGCLHYSTHGWEQATWINSPPPSE